MQQSVELSPIRTCCVGCGDPSTLGAVDERSSDGHGDDVKN